MSTAGDPEEPDTLNALGREMLERGDAAMAIALQSHALRRDPGHARAHADLARARASSITSTETAIAIYDAALRHEPDLAVHHRAVGSLQPFVGMERIARALIAAVAADPSFAPAHAARANIFARSGDRVGAMRAYALAVMLDWDFAEAHLALAQLYDTAENRRDAERHLREALVRQNVYRSNAAAPVRRVLVLKTPGSYLANALFDFVLDANRTDADVLYITEDVGALPDVSAYDVVINAISATEEHAPTIERCIALLRAAGIVPINDPASLHRVRRAALPGTLAGVPGCSTSPVLRLTHDAVQAAAQRDALGPTLPYPLLVRPIDTQRGDGLERLDSAREIAEYLTRVPAAAYTLSPFVDYRSTDGLYRKYRVIVIGGVPYPYHLAISSEWLVHYWRVSAGMRETAWMSAEEERFLERPTEVFFGWSTTFAAMAEAIGLDYFGVDCALGAGGEVLVFECDPGAFVHCHYDVDGVFAYKLRAVPRIFAAFDELLDAKRMR